ncbi:ubiquitin-conjugating enzyme E2 [Aspergillus mulundensis]|uniref:UBC core domain-containing protein n=1 Tax=Aspergillus mulundensis TaxID=1810919 RepID=A0A3D8SKT7_9EURO|nr:Uncharacterized protein DSM5745_03504 [Aspergillus mulundensis]RDW86862.1 Uncharacterized protein DSM5745_03504 [Aspergillus mulundensis]
MDSASVSSTQTEARVKFFCGDVCYLRAKPSLIGHVLRSPHDHQEPELLAGLFSDDHIDASEEDIDAFMATSTPPEGHVFVLFMQSSKGGSLFHEDDLELVDRVHGLGEIVKRHSSANDAKSGTVIGTTAKCTLEPIIYRPRDPITGDYLPVRFTEKPYEGFESSSTSEETGPALLYDVPQSELRKDEEFLEGDHIVYRQKLGLIQEVEHDVVLLLSDSKVVSPLDPYALEVPISDAGSALSKSGVKKRDLGNGQYEWTSETDFTYPGESVFIERSNLSKADRPPGIEGSVVQGYVLETPARSVHIHWECSNVFADGPEDHDPTNESLRVASLRGNAIICDFTQSASQDSLVGRSESVLGIGQRVRFRDPALAEVKYPGFCRVPAEQSFGHDLNIFQIVSIRTEVIVRWQDGSCTTEPGTALQPSDAGLDELYPGDLVALKDSVSIVDSGHRPKRTMPHIRHGRMNETLHIQQLGIVQTVDSRERTASVRWYQDTDVELIHGGKSLDPGSSLGRLGDAVTNVSVYELATFPAFEKDLGELAIVVPTSVSKSVVSSATHDMPEMAASLRMGSVTPDPFSDLSAYLQSIKSAVISSDWFKHTTTTRAPSLRRRYSIHKDDAAPSNDFFGMIVAKDFSGNATVRFPSANGCRDVQVSFERILVAFEPHGPLPGNAPANLLGSFENDDSFASNLSSDWITEDEGDALYNQFIPNQERELKVGVIESGMVTTVSEIRLESSSTPDEGETVIDSTGSTGSSLPPILRFPLPSSSPPGFAVLEDLPPADHHFINKDRSDPSTQRMKRIRKEFEILQTSLPPGIFVRSWESRMDLVRILFIGAESTPYEHATYVIDMHFHSEFPVSPPSAHFHFWATGQGSINPNLSEDGRICLSLLNTWPTQDLDERWSPRSTILQILVSIMGLVLVKNPFYNEAGYESLAAEGSRCIEASQYTEKVFLMTRRFILRALEHPVSGLEDVLAWNYVPGSTRPRLLGKAIQRARQMIEHHDCPSEQIDQDPAASAFCSRLSLGGVVMLQKHLSALERLERDLIERMGP